MLPKVKVQYLGGMEKVLRPERGLREDMAAAGGVAFLRRGWYTVLGPLDIAQGALLVLSGSFIMISVAQQGDPSARHSPWALGM